MNLLPKQWRPKQRIRTRIAAWVAGLLRRRERHTVGLTIEADAVRAVHVTRGTRGLQIAQHRDIALSPEAIVDGTLMDSAVVIDALADLHHALVAGGMPPGTRAVLGIDGHHVIVKRIELPEMTDEELEESLSWEAEQYIPFDVNDVVLGTERSRTQTEDGMMACLLVAAKREYIRDRVDIAREAGFALDAVEPYPLALRRLTSTAGFAMGVAGHIAVMHVGADQVTFTVLDGDDIAHTRAFMLGTNAFIDELQRELNVGWDDARAILHAHASGAQGAVDTVPVPPEASGAVITRTAEMLAGEYDRSFRFYAATVSAKGALRRIVLVGPGAWIPALAEAIEAQSRIPVVVPAAELAPAGGAPFGLALGLALRDDFTASGITTGIEGTITYPDGKEERIHIVGGHAQRDHRPRPTPKPYRASERELIRLFTDLTFLTERGVSFVDALSAMASDDAARNKKFRAAITAIKEDVQAGGSLTETCSANLLLPPVLATALAAMDGRDPTWPRHLLGYLLGDPLGTGDAAGAAIKKRGA